MPDAQIIGVLRKLLDEALLATDQEPLGAELETDVFLPDVVDSLVIGTMIVLIEERWDLDVDEEDIDPEVFNSLSSVADFVAQHLDVEDGHEVER